MIAAPNWTLRPSQAVKSSVFVRSLSASYWQHLWGQYDGIHGRDGSTNQIPAGPTGRKETQSDGDKPDPSQVQKPIIYKLLHLKPPLPASPAGDQFCVFQSSCICTQRRPRQEYRRASAAGNFNESSPAHVQSCSRYQNVLTAAPALR